MSPPKCGYQVLVVHLGALRTDAQPTRTGNVILLDKGKDISVATCKSAILALVNITSRKI